MAFYTKPTGTLKIRESDSSKIFSVTGINAEIEDEDTAATQLNKLFYIAGLSVTGDENTRLIIEKGVVSNG